MNENKPVKNMTQKTGEQREFLNTSCSSTSLFRSFEGVEEGSHSKIGDKTSRVAIARTHDANSNPRSFVRKIYAGVTIAPPTLAPVNANDSAAAYRTSKIGAKAAEIPRFPIVG